MESLEKTHRHLQDATMAVSSPRFPFEVILLVIESIVPPTAVLRLTDSRIPPLLALTLVSRATYRVASLLLRRHCASISSKEVLNGFLHCLDRPSFHSDLAWNTITTLHLRPFYSPPHEWGYHVHGTKKIARKVSHLLNRLAPTLRVLVLELPFTVSDYDGGSTLIAAFQRLDHLEELIFCPKGPHAGHFTYCGPQFWLDFPALRRLVLCNVPVDDSALWDNLTLMPRLEVVWLIEPDLSPSSSRPNAEEIYCFDPWPPKDPLPGRKLKVVAVVSRTIVQVGEWKDLVSLKKVQYRYIDGELCVAADIVQNTLGNSSFATGPLWDLDAAESGTLRLPQF